MSPRTRRVDFGGLAIDFDSRVLTPRPWTAAQSAWAAELLASAPEGPVLELCAGVGHIGLLAVRGQARNLVLVDANEVACAYARSNADNAGPSGRVSVLLGPLEEVLVSQGEFAIILADPPWVPTAQVGRYPDDPRFAIDGGEDGLDLVWACLSAIGRHLHDRGAAILQVGTPAQATAVQRHLELRPESRLEVRARRVHENRGVLVLLSRPSADATVHSPASSDLSG